MFFDIMEISFWPVVFFIALASVPEDLAAYSTRCQTPPRLENSRSMRHITCVFVGNFPEITNYNVLLVRFPLSAGSIFRKTLVIFPVSKGCSAIDTVYWIREDRPDQWQRAFFSRLNSNPSGTETTDCEHCKDPLFHQLRFSPFLWCGTPLVRVSSVGVSSVKEMLKRSSVSYSSHV